MIISASRRTDIPAFYSEWFMNRVREGFAEVANPFNPHQVKRVSLGADEVAAIVFWTRNPLPLMAHLAELDGLGHRYYFHYTITGYPRVLEPAVPDLEEAVHSFSELSGRIGPERVLWRYDPILLCSLLDLGGHRRNFARIASALRGKTARVTISFADFYQKTKRNLGRLAGVSFFDLTKDQVELRKLIADLACIAEDNGMELRTCATDIDFADLGVVGGKCIDEARLRSLFSIEYSSRKHRGQRGACDCVQSVDIGSYNSCMHGCAYCYATNDPARAARNRALHDPNSPRLIGPPLGYLSA